MAEKKTAKKATKKATPRTAAAGKFTAEERAAMRERAQELKASKSRAEGEKTLLAKLAAMPKADRVIGERIHAIVTKNAPDLAPKTWYGMPAYATEEGKVLCFFQSADKFKTRYATFGFTEEAKLDKGNMWPVSYALKELTPADETKIATLVKKAVS